MELEYKGSSPVTLKYKGRQISVKAGDKVDVDEETAKKLSRREVNGLKLWTSSKAKKAKKGEA